MCLHLCLDAQQGMTVPIHRLCSVTCELHNGPIVRFHSSQAHGGRCRSLVQTSPTGCHLPLLATVVLEAVLDRYEWEHDGAPSPRKCFVVSVSFAL